MENSSSKYPDYQESGTSDSASNIRRFSDYTINEYKNEERKNRPEAEKKSRLQLILQLGFDYVKKCNDDHVGAFGAMSSFFILIALFPFLIFFLTIIKMTPVSKDYIIHLITQMLAFEKDSMIRSIVNEIWRKTGSDIFTVSILVALWSASKGIYSIVMGLNSVYDIDENRNYISLRLFSLVYTVLFAILIIGMVILWMFGNMIQQAIGVNYPYLGKLLELFMSQKLLFTVSILTIVFMLIYQFIPNRKSKFLHQLPGAIVSSAGWVIISDVCSLWVDRFPNFTFLYGSVASIMIFLVWLDLCMCMVFYGAEFNYFLENKENYHRLIHVLRPGVKRLIRREQRLEQKELIEEKARKKQQKREEKKKKKEEKKSQRQTKG